jgi:hypothetical protein
MKHLLTLLLAAAALCIPACARAQIVPSAPVTANPNTGVLRTPATLAAPAWLLSGSGATDTLSPSQVGLGWADARTTVQTPAGALQFYLSGSPAVPVIYWPGRITVQTLETSSQFVGTVGAGSITAGASGGEVINWGVMLASLPNPLNAFVDSAGNAGASGITYVVGEGDLGTQPNAGTYWLQGQVDETPGTNRILAGRYRTHAQARADLAVPHLVAAPASATAAGVAGQIAYDASFFYVCVAPNTWRRVALSSW